jgi:hypothetical protein
MYKKVRSRVRICVLTHYPRNRRFPDTVNGAVHTVDIRRSPDARSDPFADTVHHRAAVTI